MSEAYIDAILTFTPKAAKRLANGYNRDPRKNGLGLSRGDLCGIYVSGKDHQQLEYAAGVNSVSRPEGADLLVEEIIGMLTFTPEEARGYIKPGETYYLISFENAREIDPISLEVLKKEHRFNPWSGSKRYYGTQRPKVKIL